MEQSSHKNTENTRMMRLENHLRNALPSSVKLSVTLRNLGKGNVDPIFNEETRKKESQRVLLRFRQEANLESTPILREWRRMNGTHRMIEGYELKDREDIETLAVSNELMKDKKINFMRCAIEHEDMASIRWAMKAGFNPNRYCPHSKSTPIGAAAYLGFAPAVRLMWEAGADPLLLLNENHTDKKSMLGTTLLHRLMRRISANESMNSRIETAMFLAEVYPDPLILDQEGMTALDTCPSTIAKENVLAVIAKRQKNSLEKTLEKSHNKIPAKKRL